MPVSDESGTPGDVTRASLKVIDPSEEIGDGTFANPLPTGSFALANVKVGTVKYLNIAFNTPLDLKGAMLTPTPVAINLPVSIAAGAATQVNAKVRLFGTADASSAKTASQTGGSTIEVEYDYDGPDGKRHVRFIIDFRLSSTTFDDDDDGYYEDEYEHEDSNNDGISDEREQEDESHDEWEELEEEGVITAVSGDTITVNGIAFILDNRTSYKDGAPKAALVKGVFVKIHGYETGPGNIYASEVEIDDSGSDDSGSSISGGGGDSGGSGDGGTSDDGIDGGPGDGGSSDDGYDGGSDGGGSGDDGIDDGSGDDGSSGDDGIDDGSTGDDGSGGGNGTDDGGSDDGGDEPDGGEA